MRVVIVLVAMLIAASVTKYFGLDHSQGIALGVVVGVLTSLLVPRK